MRLGVAILVIGLVSGSAQSAAHAQADSGSVDIERGTPRAAMESFVLAARDGDFHRAARILDLARLSSDERDERGPLLARYLKSVLDSELWIDFERISDVPEGDPEDGSRSELIGTIATTSGRSVPIRMVRKTGADGSYIWLISASTVAQIPELYEVHGPSWIEGWLPDVFSEIRVWELWLWQWAGLFVVAILSFLAAMLLARLLLAVSRRFAARTAFEWDDRLVELFRGPTSFLLALLGVVLLSRPLHLATPARAGLVRILVTLAIFATAWVAVRMVRFVAELVERRTVAQAESGEGDDLQLRGVRTQVLVLRRIASIVIGVLAVAVALLQFEVVRSVGMSLLASAGIAGIVIGLAAQRSIATLLAGIQLSITQPIRIGDTVIVEGEWGSIEEINLTYVVVKVWDERRLVVPMTKFLETPFQNWTKVSPELLGTIYIHADFSLSVDAVREELDRILEDNPKWDGRVKGVVVTDAKDRTQEIRALVSTKDAGDQWNLCCEVRERLVAWLREHEGGKHLPKLRIEEGPRGR